LVFIYRSFDDWETFKSIFLCLIKNHKKDIEIYHKLFNLLNVCGYYISFYKIDDEHKKNSELTKFDYFSNYDNIYICFNKKFDFVDCGIKKRLYHLTDNEKFKNIEKYGIKVKIGKDIDNHPERIYVFDSIEPVYDFVEKKKKYNKDFKNPILYAPSKKTQKSLANV
jgi:hypothetical protein